MKFTNPQLVAILAILMAAIIAVNVFAPTAVATVTAMATTLFTALFVERSKDTSRPPANVVSEETRSAPEDGAS